MGVGQIASLFEIKMLYLHFRAVAVGVDCEFGAQEAMERGWGGFRRLEEGDPGMTGRAGESHVC